MRILGAKDVRTILTMDHAIELMREAMALVARGETVQPLRQALWLPDKRGLLGIMPGYVAKPERLGAKILTVFPGNFARGLPSHQGAVVLFNSENGEFDAIMDAREITAIRTAAATAVATDILAPHDVETLVFFGYGEQAETHFEALQRVRKFDRLLIWGRDGRKSSDFAARHARPGLAVEAVGSAEAAASQADVICTLTAAIDPILMGRWLRPGVHVNAVGSGTAREAELDIDAVKRSRMFADNREGVLGQCGEFLRAKAAGAVDDAHVLGSVGDVMVGRIPGRSSPSQITLFKSLGMAVEDLVSAEFVLREATRRNIGVAIDW
jgi:ornithine cyclodeaminase